MTNDADFDRIFRTLPPQAGSSSSLEDPPLRARKAQNRRPARSKGKAVFAVATVLVLLLSGGGVWAVWNEYGTRLVNYFAEEEIADFEGPGSEPIVNIVIDPGDFGETVARKLAAAGVTASFESVYRLLLQDTSITFRPGTYTLLTGMSAENAIVALRDSKNRLEWRVTLPEGVRLSRALAIISESTGIPLADLEAVADPAVYGLSVPTGSLEGYLFPDTYIFEPTASATDILARMVNEMTTRLNRLGVPEEERHYFLTFAALVQREAKLDPDFAKVARVFQNRLDGVRQNDHNGRLESDATRNRDDLDASYDTYVIVGLPPGPIAMPGQVALEAVLNPAEGDWVYFVTINLQTGETIFTNTFQEHQRYVPLLRQWCAENRGFPGC